MAATPVNPPASVKVEVKLDQPEPAPAASPAPDSSSTQSAGQPASEKTPSKVEDPFAGLDTLEAEMARLLGRERLN